MTLEPCTSPESRAGAQLRPVSAPRALFALWAVCLSRGTTRLHPCLQKAHGRLSSQGFCVVLPSSGSPREKWLMGEVPGCPGDGSNFPQPWPRIRALLCYPRCSRA